MQSFCLDGSVYGLRSYVPCRDMFYFSNTEAKAQRGQVQTVRAQGSQTGCSRLRDRGNNFVGLGMVQWGMCMLSRNEDASLPRQSWKKSGMVGSVHLWPSAVLGGGDRRISVDTLSSQSMSSRFGERLVSKKYRTE